jgi:hypothetical protein
MHRDSEFFGMMHSTTTRVVRNQKLALGFEVTLANVINNRFEVASTAGSHDANFKHGPNITICGRFRAGCGDNR